MMGTKRLLLVVFVWERKWKRKREDTNFQRQIGNGIACGKFVLFYGGSHFGSHEDSWLPRGVNLLDVAVALERPLTILCLLLTPNR